VGQAHLAAQVLQAYSVSLDYSTHHRDLRASQTAARDFLLKGTTEQPLRGLEVPIDFQGQVLLPIPS